MTLALVQLLFNYYIPADTVVCARSLKYLQQSFNTCNNMYVFWFISMPIALAPPPATGTFWDWSGLGPMSIVPVHSSERGDAASVGIGRQHSGSDVGGRLPNQDEQETLPSLGMTFVCWFCDENESKVGKLLNIATAKYPKHVCSGCNGSRKALDKQGQDNATAGAALKALKKRQVEYKSHVVNSVIPGANAKGQGGALMKQQRNQALGAFFTHSAESAVTLEHARPMHWCLQEEYIGYHQQFKGKTREEALAQWKLDIANVDIMRKGEGDGTRIAVLGIPSTTEQITRTAKRALSASYIADDENKMKAASKRMALQNLPQMNTQMFLDAGGDVFNNGHASGANAALRSTSHVAIADEQPLQRDEFTKAALALADTLEEQPDGDEDDDCGGNGEKRRTRRKYTETWCRHVVDQMYTCCKHVVHLKLCRHLVNTLEMFKPYVHLCNS